MFSLEIECLAERQDLLIAELGELGSAGILELGAGQVRAFFEDTADREALAARFQAVSWRQEEECDWIAVARSYSEPLLVGERFFLVPEWRDDPAPPGRFRIPVNPGMAFGTGFHETTQLCLEALERYVAPGCSMLDVGTGSGILAQAAALLGARPVWACDTDAVAVGLARRTTAIACFTGSAGAVRSASARVIAANISPEAMVQLAPELLRCLAPDGVALLSGFERQETETVRTAFERCGGILRKARYKGSWALLAVAAARRGGGNPVGEPSI
jgi:ribosomal protein L11 methyltransferase